MDSSFNPSLAALLFSDIAGSVAMKKRLGDEAYIHLLNQHNEIFGSVLSQSSGAELIKNLGDGFLARFSSASAAVEAALLFQWELTHDPYVSEALKVRVGIHVGEIIEIKGMDGKLDVVGIAVDIAARLMGAALPSQILISRAALDAAKPLLREHPLVNVMLPPSGNEVSPIEPSRPLLCWVNHGLYLFQGHEEPLEVHEVGAVARAPQTPPPDSEKARRIVHTPQVSIYGESDVESCRDYNAIIYWDEKYAQTLFNYNGLTPNYCVINPHSVGHLHYYKTSGGCHRGYSLWETRNGEQTYSQVFVIHSEFEFTNSGRLKQIGTNIVIRKKIIEFSYGPFTHYRIRFTEWSKTGLRGKMLLVQNGNGAEELEVGDVVLELA